jgi:hypothetical protein
MSKRKIQISEEILRAWEHLQDVEGSINDSNFNGGPPTKGELAQIESAEQALLTVMGIGGSQGTDVKSTGKLREIGVDVPEGDKQLAMPAITKLDAEVGRIYKMNGGLRPRKGLLVTKIHKAYDKARTQMIADGVAPASADLLIEQIYLAEAGKP